MKEILKYHENLDTLHIGTEEPRSYYLPKGEAGEERVIMLSGEWKLLYENCYEDLPDDCTAKDFDISSADSIVVPSCLQMKGYGTHQYTNVKFPIPYMPPFVPKENPAALYLKDVTIEILEGNTDRYFLNFEGVDSCLYVWVNGSFAGYSQVSHSTSEFEITKLLVNGMNRFAVLVLKWCDGSYLEDQDKLRMSGIFRDVYIIKRPETFLRDFTVLTSRIEVGEYKSAWIKVMIDEISSSQNAKGMDEWIGSTGSVDTENPIGVIPITCELFDEKGRSKCRVETFSNKGELMLTIKGAHLWSSERPYLYDLVLTMPGETITTKVGIRQIRRAAIPGDPHQNEYILLNDKPIRLRGVNRHDSNADTGYTISKEQAMEDLKLMKSCNINAIRTSHYPNAPWFSELCDQYGFYLIGESDLECHGVVELPGCGYNETYNRIADDETFSDSIYDRVRRNVVRDKNRPSIIMWSLGNESGFGCCMERAARFVKEYDPSRLLQYEGSIYAAQPHCDLSNLDVYSRMYDSIEGITSYCEDPNRKIPYMQCEFSHAMGNGPGDLEDYMQLMHKYPQYVGGFVWEWCDHSVVIGADQQGNPKYGYGGDFGDIQNDGNFCIDGLIKPDRTPHTGLYEYKNVLRPVRARLLEDYLTDSNQENEKEIAALRKQLTPQIRLELENCMDFTDIARRLDVFYEIHVEGLVLERGTLALPEIAPGKTGKTFVPYAPVNGRDTHIRLIYRLRNDEGLLKAGTILGTDQLLLNAGEFYETLSKDPTDSGLTLVESGSKIIVKGRDFEYVFNRFSGTFSSMLRHGRKILKQPMSWNIFRAPVDNDAQVRWDWYRYGYNRSFSQVCECSACIGEDSIAQIRAIGVISAAGVVPIVEFEVTWQIDHKGQLSMNCTAKKNESYPLPYLPRFGLKMGIASTNSFVSYYGYGPYESYIDKHQASMIGLYHTNVDEMHEDYIRPQENGHHYGCSFLDITDETDDSHTIHISSKTGFEFNVSRYTIEELASKAHNYELVCADHIEVCLDAAMSGMGSGSCGPMLAKQYQADRAPIDWNLFISFED